MDEVQHSETPGGVLPGLLVKAATRRQVSAALKAIPLEEFADEIRTHLIDRAGISRADAIINDMARGLVFK